jgi:hypothetical protein
MIDARARQVAACSGPLLAATLSRVGKTCAKPTCGCRDGGRKHPAYHLTVKEQGKTRTVYVPKDLLPQVRAWLAEYKRLKGLLKQMSLLTLALVRNHVKDRRHKKGRP